MKKNIDWRKRFNKVKIFVWRKKENLTIVISKYELLEVRKIT